MAMTNEQILDLPIRYFDRATRRLKFELADGTPFYLIGGKDDRPRTKGVAYFKPREMIMIVNEPLDEQTFRGLIRMKVMGLAEEIVEITDAKPAAP
jgi:hypothetical protein